jgi:hypothetical protein
MFLSIFKRERTVAVFERFMTVSELFWSLKRSQTAKTLVERSGTVRNSHANVHANGHERLETFQTVHRS